MRFAAIFLLLCVPVARADVSKYFPKKTFVVVSVDVPKVIDSKLARQLMPGEKKPTVAGVLEQVGKATDNTLAITFVQLSGAPALLQKVVDTTTRITVVQTWSTKDQPETEPLVIAEGKYDGPKLLKELQSVGKWLNLEVQTNMVADQDTFTLVKKGEAESPQQPSLAFIRDGVLLAGTRGSVTAALQRTQADQKATLHPKMAAALKSMGNSGAVNFAVAVTEGPEQAVVVGELAFTQEEIHANVDVTLNLEEVAVDFERTALRAFVEVAYEVADLDPSEAIRAVRVSRDGRKVSLRGTAATDTVVPLVKMALPGPARPEPDLSLTGFPGQMGVIAVSQDGKLVAAVTGHTPTKKESARVVVWNVADRSILADFKFGEPTKEVGFWGRDLCFSADAKRLSVQYLTSDYQQGDLVQYELTTRKIRWQRPSGGAVGSPSANLIASYTGFSKGKSTLALLDADTGEVVRELTFEGGCNRLFFSPKGDYLAAECYRIIGDPGEPLPTNTVRIWETATGKVGTGLRVDGPTFRGQVWFPGQKEPSLVDRVGRLVVKDERELGTLRVLPEAVSVLGGFMLSADANRLAVLNSRSIKLLDLTGGKTLRFRTRGGTLFSDAAFSGDGKRIFAGNGDRVLGWNLK